MIGKSITRKEDLRLLTGRGSYVEHVQMPGLLHVSFFRGPHAATAERAEVVWPAIAEMARLSARAAAAELNRRGVKTASSKPWHSTQIIRAGDHLGL